MLCLFSPKSDTRNAVSLESTCEDLQRRVDSLVDDETQIYKWLREYYSVRWIAETLFISRAQFRVLSKSLCSKLGVPSINAMRRIYSQFDVPKRRELVSTEEIDNYVETRTEKEIQTLLNKSP